MANFRNMKNLLILLGILLTHFSFSQDLESIRKQLEQIERKNLELRSKVMPTVKKFGFGSPQMDSLDAQILQFDSTSLVFVTGIIEEHGWLGKNTIGEATNRTLFLVVQHAPNNATRKMYFPLLEASAINGESELSDMATMKDRILVQDGESQIYGTQSSMVNGELEPFSIEDPKNVNKRRKKVGLGKMK